jgi:tripartite-type tricarboxylate transporter receptor subunit TctC
LVSKLSEWLNNQVPRYSPCVTHPQKGTDMRTNIATAALALGIALSATANSATAAEASGPPIRMVVPLFVGAGTDIIARHVARPVTPQPIDRVDNRPGASTTLGLGM